MNEMKEADKPEGGMLLKAYRNIDILLVLILGLFPLYFFHGSLLLMSGEGIKDLDIHGFFRYWDWYTWRSQVNLGEFNLWQPHLFIYDAFFACMYFFGLPMNISQMLWHVFLWTGAGIAMVFLVRTICKGRWDGVWSFYAALLYLFNTFVMFKQEDENFRLVYMALPLMLGLFIKGLQGSQTTFYAILIGLASLLFSTASVNPPAVSIIWLTLSIYFIFYLILNRETISIRHWYFPGKIISIYLLLNVWWMFNTVSGMVAVSSSFSSVLTFTSLITPLYEAFRFMGSWAFREGDHGIPYLLYWEYYYGKGIIITLCSYLVPIVALCGWAIVPGRKGSERSFVVFFVILAVVALVLVKGSASPFGGIYQFVWENVPGFWVFREPFTKFTPLLIFAASVLFGYAVSRINDSLNISALYKFLGGAGVILIVFIAVYPFFSQQVFRKESIKSFKSRYIRFPDYWVNLGSWLQNNDKTSKVFVLPQSGYGVAYNWEHGAAFAGPVTTLMLPNPTLMYRPETTYGEKIVNELYSYLSNNDMNSARKTVRLLGVKYVLLQGDFDWIDGPGTVSNPNQLLTILNRQNWLVLHKKFGELQLFKVKDDIFRFSIQTAERLIEVK